MPTRRGSFVWWFLTICIGAGTLFACGTKPKEINAPVVVSTRTLVLATSTPVPRLHTLTPTPTDLPVAADLLPATTPEPDGRLIAPVAQMFIDRISNTIASQQQINPTEIRLLSLEAFAWNDDHWGCQTRALADDPPLPATSGYRIVLGTQTQVFVYHTDDQETFFRCEDHAWLDLEGEPIPVDPIAQSMVDLAEQDAARRLDQTQSEIALRSLVAVSWPDSSLGCPKASGDYEVKPILGYRMVFQAGEMRLIYHTSIQDMVLCDPGEEILPGTLRHAIPTPTPEPEASS